MLAEMATQIEGTAARLPRRSLHESAPADPCGMSMEGVRDRDGGRETDGPWIHRGIDVTERHSVAYAWPSTCARGSAGALVQRAAR